MSYGIYEIADDYCAIEEYDEYYLDDNGCVIFHREGSGMYYSSSICLSFDELRKWYVEINKPINLSNIAKKDFIRQTSMETIKNTNNESDLAKIAINGSMSSIRREAVKKIHNELVLSEVAKSDTDFLTRNDALKKIHNIDILKDIANNASVEYTRNKAKERLPEKPKTNNQNKKKTIRPMGSGPLKTDNPSQNPYLSEKLHEKLKKCPLCNNTLSKIVKKCPYCGYDFNNPKKIFEQKSTVKWQYCTECGHRLNKVAKKCPYCNKILE